MKKVCSALSILALATTMVVAQGPGNGMDQGNHPAAANKKGERHPEIRKALRQLEAAKDSLQHADHDFAGHREKALDDVQHAIDECHQALAADKQ